jgi:hypothetical protein
MLRISGEKTGQARFARVPKGGYWGRAAAIESRFRRGKAAPWA